MDHFTVVCSVSWPLDGSKTGVDLVLIQTSLLLLCKTSCSDANDNCGCIVSEISPVPPFNVGDTSAIDGHEFLPQH